MKLRFIQISITEIVTVIILVFILYFNFFEVSNKIDNLREEVLVSNKQENLDSITEAIELYKTYEFKREIDIITNFILEENYKIGRTYYEKDLANEVATQIVIKSTSEGLPISLIVGMMRVESIFNPEAISKLGAKGLMQVYDKTCDGKVIDQTKLFNIDYNIEMGLCIFKNKLVSSDYNIRRAVYFYVGKDKQYVEDVFTQMGRFVQFRGEKLKLLNQSKSDRTK